MNAYDSLAGRVILVTGAASGIGRATAALFARQGARVGVADIDAEGAKQTSEELRALGAEHLMIRLDVTSADDWDAGLQTIRAHWGGLDVLVNCAGISDDAPLAEMTLDQWRRVLAVNLDGVFLGMKAAINAMSPKGHGAIVNVSSLSGIKASAGAAAYCTSKAGIIQITRVGALECAQAGLNIRVNCVAPGGVKTPMWEKTPMWPAISETSEWLASESLPPLKRFATANEIAQTILFLASDAASYISGAVLTVDGGASA